MDIHSVHQEICKPTKNGPAGRAHNDNQCKQALCNTVEAAQTDSAVAVEMKNHVSRLKKIKHDMIGNAGQPTLCIYRSSKLLGLGIRLPADILYYENVQVNSSE